MPEPQAATSIRFRTISRSPTDPMTLPTRTASVYLAPLREGGSLPAVVGDQDGELWVVKFRGAGQGPKALVAEILVAGIAEVLGLRAPGLSLVTR